eukprot:6176960-Pleurochrysis_carterae.AAC.1
MAPTSTISKDGAKPASRTHLLECQSSSTGTCRISNASPPLSGFVRRESARGDDVSFASSAGIARVNRRRHGYCGACARWESNPKA